MRILVAEDNHINQMVVTKMLDRLSYNADFVCDGREAVAAAGRVLYDVILMDVMMPIMGGIEASVAIRRAESPAHRAHIIALTANAMDEDRERCIGAGMDDFISKPFVLDTLREKLSAIAAAIQGVG